MVVLNAIYEVLNIMGVKTKKLIKQGQTEDCFQWLQS